MDYRLYSFEGGILHKVIARFHKHKTIDSVDEAISRIRRTYNDVRQLIVVEYFGTYDSKIVRIIEPV